MVTALHICIQTCVYKERKVFSFSAVTSTFLLLQTPWTHMNNSFIVGNRWLSFAPHILWRLAPQLFMKTRVKCSLMFIHLDKQTTSSQRWQTCQLFVCKSAVSTRAPTFVFFSLSLQKLDSPAQLWLIPPTCLSWWSIFWQISSCMDLSAQLVWPSLTDQEVVVRTVRTGAMFYTSTGMMTDT